jgi:NhaP-type Na+/H+ or K+/H+ antiporter
MIAAWSIFAGVLLVWVALSSSLLKRSPVSTAILYLGAGALVGPLGFAMLEVDPLGGESPIVEHLAEIAVSFSLFAAGLKMRVPPRDRRWWLPIRLASITMILTVAAIAVVGVVVIGLPWGGAILLGAVLAPTDPVLAADVQVEAPGDDDALRFGLTGEAGFNDGAAFPFVMLGLGLLGLHDLGEGGWRWLAVDVLWAIAGALAVGGALGAAMAHLVLYLRKTHREALGLDDFLALGLMALSYGVALALHAYAFLAVFAAGVALRAVERRLSEERGQDGPRHDVPEEHPNEDQAADPDEAHAHMAAAVLVSAEQFERIGEAVLVVLVGSMLIPAHLTWNALWFVPLVMLVIRPAAVWLGLLGAPIQTAQRHLICWFGIRGIGSVYYLMYAENHGLPDGVARPLLTLVLATIAASIVVHGITVTPLMRWYERRQRTAAR